MKMTINQALLSNQALQQFGTNKINIDVSLKLAGNQRILKEVATEYEKRRNETVKKYGEPNGGGTHKVKDENTDKFQDAITLIMEEVVDLDLKTISLSDLPVKFEIESNTLVPLEWMITPRHKKSNKRHH